MKKRISMFCAALAFGLLMTAGTASAEPGQVCEYDGTLAYSYEYANGQFGWHIWECWSGTWQYYHYCGDQICAI